MRVRKVGRYYESTAWGALGTEWSSGTWAHYNHRHVLGGKKYVKFIEMGLDIKVYKDTWKVMVAMETDVAEAPTPRREPGSWGRVWTTTWAYMVMLATVMCSWMTMFWVYLLVKRSPANHRKAVQNQLLN